MKALYFTATWCGPCKQFKPLFKKVSEEYDLNVFEVDVDENQDIASENQVMSVPTVIIYKDEQEVDRFVGAFPEPILRKRLTNLG